MGLLDAVAGAVRGGAGAVGDIADSEIKTNQQARLQQQHGDIQGQLNQQLSDLNVAAAQKVADYQQTVAGQVRDRRAGYTARGDNGDIDLTGTARNAIGAGEADYGDSILAAQNKSEKVVPYGGVALNPDGTVRYDNSVARGQAALLSAGNRGRGKFGWDALADAETRAPLLTNAVVRAVGPAPTTTTTNPQTGDVTKTPDPRYTGVLHLAQSMAADQFNEKSTSVQPFVDWARQTESQIWQAASARYPDDPKLRQQQYETAIIKAAANRQWAAPAAAPPPPPSAGPAGQPQRAAAAASAAPAAEGAAQSDAARASSAAGLLSSAKSSGPTTTSTGFKELDPKTLNLGPLRRMAESETTSPQGRAAAKAELARRGAEAVKDIAKQPAAPSEND